MLSWACLDWIWWFLEILCNHYLSRNKNFIFFHSYIHGNFGLVYMWHDFTWIVLCCRFWTNSSLRRLKRWRLYQILGLVTSLSLEWWGFRYSWMFFLCSQFESYWHMKQMLLQQRPNKRRLSLFKGIIIAKHKSGVHTTIRVRRIIAGVGVEITFPM